MIPSRLLAFPLTALLASPAIAAAYQIVHDESIFAVVTHKGGLAAGAAHNHLVVATEYQARLDVDEADSGIVSFEFETATDQLVVDDPAHQAAWYPRLEELGVLDEPFSDVADGDRAKIRKAMLGKKQLDSEQHPRIHARIVGVENDPTTLGDTSFPHAARLSLEVHGQTVERAVPMRWEITDGELRAEALGSFRFTEFDIEPYSAFFGAVKNQDEYHVYVSIVARRSSE